MKRHIFPPRPRAGWKDRAGKPPLLSKPELLNQPPQTNKRISNPTNSVHFTAELARQHEQLEKERNHILNALETLRRKGCNDPDLEAKLCDLDEAIAQNDYRAANIRAGYVYIISNRGAFGANVVKIGLTRRLEPLDRVNELGDASVPFLFDVHCLFFSEDAVTLEAELHQHFADRKVNHVNLRKEFFFASPAEVRELLRSKLGNLLEFTEHAEAADFHQSLGYWPEVHRARARG